MANNLKKIKGLTFSRELSDRVGVAMFLYAKNIGEDASLEDKQLAQWTLSNPMGVDNTMLALVATDTTVMDTATIIEKTVQNTKNAELPSDKGNAEYTPVDVSIEAVSDAVIEAAVKTNWNRVAQKYVTPTPVNEGVSIIPGDLRNPRQIAAPTIDSSPIVEEQLHKSKNS